MALARVASEPELVQSEIQVNWHKKRSVATEEEKEEANRVPTILEEFDLLRSDLTPAQAALSTVKSVVEHNNLVNMTQLQN